MSNARYPYPTRLLTTREAAAALGVHERTLRRYVSSGLLGCRRLPGGHYRIPEEAIRDLWSAGDARSQGVDGRRGPNSRSPTPRARQRRPVPGVLVARAWAMRALPPLRPLAGDTRGVARRGGVSDG
jgi:excisionase family DNA binding protein